MRRRKLYPGVRFTEPALRAFIGRVREAMPGNPSYVSLVTDVAPRDEWSFDTEEEFFAEYRKTGLPASLDYSWGGYGCTISFEGGRTAVTLTHADRDVILTAFSALELFVTTSTLPIADPIIFIGHGRAPDWRDLADHLRDVHGLEVLEFGSQPRAGRTVTEVIEEMANMASFAIAVHTAEDEVVDGTVRARENVVHETGLFQGILGLRRAIVVRESGCADFSNLHGVQEIRYRPGVIREAFGDVLGTIRREFPTAW